MLLEGKQMRRSESNSRKSSAHVQRSFVVAALVSTVMFGACANAADAPPSTGCKAMNSGRWNFFTRTSSTTKPDNFSKGERLRFSFYNLPPGPGGQYSFSGSLSQGGSGGGTKVVTFRVSKTGLGSLTLINVGAIDYAVSGSCNAPG